jgi:hypothetical protein
VCHLAPIALTATSGIGRRHALHRGLCSRTWQRSQYGWPLWMTKSDVSDSSAALCSVPAADDLLGSRNGSPHSEQKKCSSW